MNDTQVRAMRNFWTAATTAEQTKMTAKEFALSNTGKCWWSQGATLVETEKIGTWRWDSNGRQFVKTA